MPMQCTSCGALVEGDDDLLATVCRFCGSSLVSASSPEAMPDLVIPFRVPRAAAAERMRAHMEAQLLAPEALRLAAAPAELRSVFVPMWVFEAQVRSDIAARVGFEWEHDETYTSHEDGKAVTRTRTVREIEWFPFKGRYGRLWDDHLVSASKGIQEAEANALEPYDVGAAVPFMPALVSGHVAELPSLSEAQGEKVARAEVSALAEDAITKQFMPGDIARALDIRTKVELDDRRVVLVPVWMAVYGEGAGSARVLVNGQTGRATGDVPRSVPKMVGLALVTILVLTFLANLIFLVVG